MRRPIPFLSGAAFALMLAPAAAAPLPGPVEAGLVRVIDGDTIEVAARVWIGHEIVTRVRLDGVDAPEIFRPGCAREKELGARAKAHVEALLEEGGVRLFDVRDDKFGGRVVARVETAAGLDLGEALQTEGLAVPYGERKDWCAAH